MADLSPKPCPFPLPDGMPCGHIAYVHSAGDIFDAGVVVGTFYHVRCGNHSRCAATGPIDMSRDSCVRRWNAVGIVNTAA